MKVGPVPLSFPGTRGLVVLGNKSGETTEPQGDAAKDHVTRTYASDLLLYQNTFTNRARLTSATTTEAQDKNIFTLRANKGRFIYWSNNTTYGGSTMLGAVAGGTADPSIRVQHVVIESNRFIQDPRDSTGLNRDSHLGRLEFNTTGNSAGTNPVANVMLRNNYFENPRGLSKPENPNAPRERGYVITGPTERVYFLHNTFVHKQNEDRSSTPNILNKPWLRLRRQLNGAASLNVFRGNLIVSQQAAAPSSNTQRIMDIDDTTSQAQAGNGLFMAGQVLDNVFPAAPSSTAYVFRFAGTERAFMGTSGAPSWGNIFSDDEQLSITLDGTYKPTTSNIDNAVRVNSFFGLIADLYGTLRPDNTDTLTKGAVQR